MVGVTPLLIPCSRSREGMEADDLLCSCNARSPKVWRKGERSFLCSRSARPPKGLARRPQSKAPHSLAWRALKGGRAMSGRAQWKITQSPSLKR